MALPTTITLDTSYDFIIYQHQFSGGEKVKAISSEMTITGKKSRQHAWNPRVWEVTVWLREDASHTEKQQLETIWELDGEDDEVHTFKLGTGSTYNVNIDGCEFVPHEAIQERWLANLTIIEVPA